MNTLVQPAFVGARGIDSEPFSHSCDPAHCRALKGSGIDFVVLYLSAVTSGMLQNILSAGLAFMPVTYANRFDGAAAVKQCEVLGLPRGVTVWLDLEGKNVWTMNPQELISKINGWADAVRAAGFEAGLYIGSPQPLTGEELFALHVTRYWKAPSNVIDRNGKLTQPSCGFCMYQLWDSRNWAGVWSDLNFVQKDIQGRLPHWAIAGSVGGANDDLDDQPSTQPSVGSPVLPQIPQATDDVE